MPHQGYKSLTISEEIYDKFEAHYKILKEKNQLPLGVSSLAGYLNYRITKHLEETQKLANIAKQIKVIPPQFLETKTQLKPLKKIQEIAS